MSRQPMHCYQQRVCTVPVCRAPRMETSCHMKYTGLEQVLARVMSRLQDLANLALCRWPSPASCISICQAADAATSQPLLTAEDPTWSAVTLRTTATSCAACLVPTSSRPCSSSGTSGPITSWLPCRWLMREPAWGPSGGSLCSASVEPLSVLQTASKGACLLGDTAPIGKACLLPGRASSRWLVFLLQSAFALLQQVAPASTPG